MANQKVTELTENTALVAADLVYIVDDPAGTPLSQKATAQTLSNFVRADIGAFAQTASVTVANSDAEATILGAGSGSLTLAAAFLNTIGKTLHVRVMGVISNTGTPDITVKLKLGATVISTTGAVTTPASLSDSIFIADFYLTARTTGATGTVFAQGNLQLGSNLFGAPATAAVTVDLTGALAVDVTVEWSAADAANTITATNAVVEKVN